MTPRERGVGLAVAVAVPFAVTGMYWMLPMADPALPFPFLAVAVAGLWLAMQGGVQRAAGVGMLAGGVLWAVFLFWLTGRAGS